MTKITRTQRRRLIASSIAFIAAAAMLMPTTTDARGGGGHGGGGHGGRGFHGGVRNIPLLGFTHRHITPSPGISVARRTFFSHNHIAFSNGQFAFSTGNFAFSHGHVAFGRSQALGSNLFPFGAGGVWIDSSAERQPTVVVLQQPVIMEQQAAARAPAVKTPSAAQQGILVVRGDTKSYVSFPNAQPG